MSTCERTMLILNGTSQASTANKNAVYLGQFPCVKEEENEVPKLVFLDTGRIRTNPPLPQLTLLLPMGGWIY